MVKLVGTELHSQESEDNRGSKLLNGWWVLYLQRWPVVSLRKGDLFAVVH